MSKTKVDLSALFAKALNTVTANREEINRLDGYNGDHGDNMVENLRVITEALRAKRAEPASKALQYASQQLEENGQGGSSRYYADGLKQAAEQLQGQTKIGKNDVAALVLSLLNVLPSEGYPERAELGGNVLEQVMEQAKRQQSQAESQKSDLNVADLISTLLPMGLAFMQAKQSGADSSSAALQALMSSLMSGGMNPLQANSPRTAAGGLIAQSILKALLGSR